MNLTAYRYDRKLGCYIGQARVMPTRHADGRLVYELPLDSTLVEAPETQAGEAAVFLERTQHWVIVSDHRGEMWEDYAGRRQVIDRLGDPSHWDMKPSRGRIAS